jgi:hypothetical protein
MESTAKGGEHSRHTAGSEPYGIEEAASTRKSLCGRVGLRERQRPASRRADQKPQDGHDRLTRLLLDEHEALRVPPREEIAKDAEHAGRSHVREHGNVHCRAQCGFDPRAVGG